MKLAFSTLGCPRWSLEQVIRAALRFGYAGVELRCLDGEVDLLRLPEFQPGEIADTRARFEHHALEVSCVDTSACFHAVDGTIRRENVDVATRYGELAAALGSPLIRVFPNEVPEGSSREETGHRIAESLHALAERLPPEVTVALETHGDFATGAAVADIVRLADHPAVGIVWDAANTTAAGEPVAAAADAVTSRLVHVHLRDARPVAGQRFWQPVLAGRGLVPFDQVIAALDRIGYARAVSFEWEKFWHPEIEEPEIALEDFTRSVASAA
ncbi:MAG: sugar phosphate isomerase/epimerase family protein [Candidatus Binatia bacterium]